MKPRFILASLAVALAGMVLFAYAGEPAKQAPGGDAAKDELASKEQQLARQFAEFQSQLLRLKQRLEKGTPDERKRAEALGKLLETIQKDGLTIQFEQLADLLRESKLSNVPELRALAERSATLADRLRDYLRMLQEDPRQKQLAAEREFLRDLLKTVDKIIQKEKQVQGLTEAGKTDTRELQKNQNQITQKTGELQKAIDKFLGKDGGDGKSAKDQLKGGPKDGGKTDVAKAEAKGDEESPGGEKAPSQAQAKDAGNKPGDKSPKGDAKPGATASDKTGKGSDTPEAQAKDGKGPEGTPATQAKKDGKGPDSSAGSQAKAGAKGNEAQPKGNDSQASAKGSQGQAKANEKSGSPKGSEGSPSQAKAGSKPGEQGSKAGAKDAKGSEGSPSQAKSGGKPGEKSPQASAKSPHGQAKEGSQGQSQAKNASEKGSQGSQGSQASAKGGDQNSQGSQASQGSQDQPPQQGNQKTKDELANNKKRIQEAGYDMKKAEDNLEQKKRPPAVANQQDAIDKLEKVKQDLEKLLRQTREEELERLLAALEARCRKMLEMQVQVLAGTEATHKAVLSHADKKPAREDQQSALKLSDNEKDIITEANKAIQMLEEEGSAVAFPEVFQQVREDMKHVQRRLEVADVAEVTQAVEKDIIASLQEMIDALKKARQELDKNKGAPKDGQPPPNADQKLLDKIAELKMIRSLQKRINDRTQFYGRLFPGEQALDPNLRMQLQQLSQRQERIFEIMDRFAKGDGK